MSPCLEVEAGGDTDRDRDRDLEPDLDLDLLSSGDIIGEENLLENGVYMKFRLAAKFRLTGVVEAMVPI